ncbi:MAG: Asp/Glu racemase [Pseudomonadota bacterium]
MSGPEADRTLLLLHTAESNIAVFEAAHGRLSHEHGVSALRHTVRADLLAAARRAGGLSADTVAATYAALEGMAAQGKVICTCSTLGPVCDTMQAEGQDVLRVDRALAVHALRAEGSLPLAVMIAAPTTRAATADLFGEVAQQVGEPEYEVVLVERAWPRFEAGDLGGYSAALVEAAEALPGRFRGIALAQSSMALAAPAVRAARPDLSVFTSPDAALAAAMGSENTGDED